MEFLLGNPFTTPVGHCIERATDGSLQSEDWALNMEICDIINETEDGPKDAIRAVKKKLGGNKNYREVMLTLTVLETCVKNCGHRFHALVTSRDFVDGVLVKVISPKNNPPTIVQDKVLALIQVPPVPEGDSALHKYSTTQPKTQSVPPPYSSPPASFQPKMSLNILQICRLRSELDVVRGNTKVMSEMLTEMVPGQEEASDYELLQELNRTCRAMQQRIVELISCVSNEAVTEELLHVNDDLNNIFLRYERYERFRSGRSSAQSVNNGVLSEATEDNLIDLGPGSPAVVSNMARRPTSPATLASRLAGLDMGVDSVSSTLSSLNSCKPTPAQDDFDVFAQTRTGGRAVNRFVYWKSLFFLICFAVFVAGICFIWWFSCRHSCDVFGFLQKGDEAEEGVTSEEFDKFLEERAKAAEMAPSLPSPPSGTPGEGQGTPGRKKPDRREDSLFAM
uniref:Target of myb1 like 2 membrane trafficking protein n=1 Tax=Oryzias latipes TaxID=8090 RepID=H2LDN0_ORYLA